MMKMTQQFKNALYGVTAAALASITLAATVHAQSVQPPAGLKWQ
jgi:hypothetical protein